jgi:hypothetical protein
MTTTEARHPEQKVVILNAVKDPCISFLLSRLSFRSEAEESASRFCCCRCF